MCCQAGALDGLQASLFGYTVGFSQESVAAEQSAENAKNTFVNLGTSDITATTGESNAQVLTVEVFNASLIYSINKKKVWQGVLPADLSNTASKISWGKGLASSKVTLSKLSKLCLRTVLLESHFSWWTSLPLGVHWCALALLDVKKLLLSLHLKTGPELCLFLILKICHLCFVPGS